MTLHTNNYSSANSENKGFPNKILFKIENRLLDPTNRLPGNFYIHGDPHIGKTKLLRELYCGTQPGGRLSELFTPFWIDLELLPGYNEFVFWRFLIDKLFVKIIELSESGEFSEPTIHNKFSDLLDEYKNLQEEYKEIAESKDLYRPRQVYAHALKLLKSETKRKTLLFIDNFQVITNEFEIDDLKSVLSKMHGDYEREEQPLQYIISSSDSLAELRKRQKEESSKNSFVLREVEHRIRATGYSKFTGIFSSEIVQPLIQNEAENYVRTFLPNFDSAEQIYRITGGLPYFIEIVCNQIMELSLPNTNRLEYPFLENLKLRIFNNDSVINHLEILWHDLESEPILIEVLHFINSQNERFVALEELQKEFSDVYIEGLLMRLSDSGWIIEKESGYRISSFLMTNFINRKANEANKTKSVLLSPVEHWNDAPSVKIQLDRENEAILRGKRIQLTELEYKLLESLTTHPNQPLTREELSRKLWGKNTIFDQKTRANLDQIVKRLRKKVEIDTSSPEIIQSVRNSGYIARL
ncbi:MAG: helix-turn-helix domain-containing protein [Pyrinomonadaceae bacterium]